jgi:hypothetical protein
MRPGTGTNFHREARECARVHVIGAAKFVSGYLATVLHKMQMWQEGQVGWI